MVVTNEQVIKAFDALREEIRRTNGQLEVLASSIGNLVLVAQQVTELKQLISSLEISLDDLKRDTK